MPHAHGPSYGQHERMTYLPIAAYLIRDATIVPPPAVLTQHPRRRRLDPRR
jgi:hypothetical protein